MSPRTPLTRQSGFTLVELVVTMIIIGIMAFVAIPKFNAIGAFDARGHADQLESYLRFAQKSALAQRRYVSISGLTSTATAPTLNVEAVTGCTGVSATLTLPGGFTTGKSTVTITDSGSGSICFDTLGGTTTTRTLTFKDDTNATIRTITVEAVTGYVHSS